MFIKNLSPGAVMSEKNLLFFAFFFFAFLFLSEYLVSFFTVYVSDLKELYKYNFILCMNGTVKGIDGRFATLTCPIPMHLVIKG